MLREEKPAVRVRVCGDLARFADCDDDLDTQSSEVAIMDIAPDLPLTLDNVRNIAAVISEEAA